MFDIDTRNLKKRKNLFYVFLTVGIFFFLVFGGIFFSNIIKINNMDSIVLSSRVEVK